MIGQLVMETPVQAPLRPAVFRSAHLRHCAEVETAFGARTECVQLSEGPFTADALELCTDAVTLRSLVCNRGIQLRRWVDSRKLLIAYVNQAEVVLEHGRPWAAQSVLLVVNGGEVDMSCLGASDTTWIEVDLTCIGETLQRALLFANMRAKGQVLVRNTTAFSALRNYAATILGTRDPNPMKLLRLVQEVVEATALEGADCTQRKDVALVRRVERFMWENLEEPLTLQRICENTGCRMRSLIYSFKEWFGLGPIKYLKILRLNAVHRRLEETRGSARIFDVAADYGFWHMGHFSSDYKQMFGVTPSETVTNARANGASAMRKMGSVLRLADRQPVARAG